MRHIPLRGIKINDVSGGTVAAGTKFSLHPLRASPTSKRVYGWTKQKIMDPYRFIDWIMALPGDLEKAYHRELTRYEEEIKMPDITTADRSESAHLCHRSRILEGLHRHPHPVTSDRLGYTCFTKNMALTGQSSENSLVCRIRSGA